VDVLAADRLEDGWREWLLWSEVVAEHHTDEFHRRMGRENARLVRADQGRTLGFTRVVGRRR